MISGACGFIGREITKAFLKQGCDVFGLVVNPQNLDEITENRDRLHLIKITFDDYSNLSQMIEERGFDAFIHMAWAGYGNETNNFYIQLKNVIHTCEAAYAAAEFGCKKFILADSSHEYLKNKNEKNILNEIGLCSIYGAAKNSAQRMCRVITHNTGMVFNGVIFTNVFGPGDMSQRSTNTMVRKLLKGEPLDLVEGNRLYDWTYVDDCVGGVIAVTTKGIPGKVYYVGSKMLRPFRDIITDVRDILAPEVKLNFGKFNDNSYIDYSNINTYELYEDTGYLPSSDFRESIKKTAEWLKKYDSHQ